MMITYNNRIKTNNNKIYININNNNNKMMIINKILS